MKSKMFKKLMAAVLATTMTASLAACGTETGNNGGESKEIGSDTPTKESTPSTDSNVQDTSSEEVGMAPILKDPNGNVYDLDGMEIIIRDWWSGDGTPKEPENEYEEKTQEYREWIQETYNFKIKRMAISGWGDVPGDFTNYVQSGGDDNNYVFVLREDSSMTAQMKSDMMFDLASLSTINLNDPKFQVNKLHEMYTFGDKVYAMYDGYSEARTGIYFNKTLLKDAGVNPEDIYDMQAKGTWTWDAFEELCAKVQRDTNADGIIDVYACNCNNSMFPTMAVHSNGGAYVGKDKATGKYTYELESPETVEALEWSVEIFNKYWQVEPKVINEETGEEQNAPWDYYKTGFINNEYVFMIEDAYCGQEGNWLADKETNNGIDFGFVMFPKGPQYKENINKWSNNPVVIPGCYDKDRAEKIAFAWNLYTNDTPGYENSDSWKTSYYKGFSDTRAVDETISMMRTQGVYSYAAQIPDFNEGPDFTWGIGPGAVVSEKIEAIAQTWKGYIEAANN